MNLLQFGVDFVTFFSEFFLPESQKTISSVDAGGIAGGSKYVCSQIFFKFALDSQVCVYVCEGIRA